MSFGPILLMQVGELEVKLAPFAREDMATFISPGMHQASVTRYISRTGAPSLEDELEWYDKVRTDDKRIDWGIWVKEGRAGYVLIGTTSLNGISERPTYQAVTGSVIFEPSYWGKGIAGHIHRARTMYAFDQLGMHRLKSAVIHGNGASLRALEKVGYVTTWTERNEKFIDGGLRHMDHLECLNPAEWAWQQWWHGDTPTKRHLAARARTAEAIEWARAHVTVP